MAHTSSGLNDDTISNGINLEERTPMVGDELLGDKRVIVLARIRLGCMLIIHASMVASKDIVNSSQAPFHVIGDGQLVTGLCPTGKHSLQNDREVESGLDSVLHGSIALPERNTDPRKDANDLFDVTAWVAYLIGQEGVLDDIEHSSTIDDFPDALEGVDSDGIGEGATGGGVRVERG